MNKENLETIRNEIDKIDKAIISLFKKREKLIFVIKKYKNTVTDRKREKNILDKCKKKYIQKIYKILFRHSKKILKKLKNKPVQKK